MNDTTQRTLIGTKTPFGRRLMWVIAGLVVVVVLIVIAANSPDDANAQISDIGSQGSEADPVSGDGATLLRAADGIRVTIDMPTPEPGSYEYPTADMVPPGAPRHPEVLVGTLNEPEAFTLWTFVFNHPEMCTDACNDDDLDPDAKARGGVYQSDGRIAGPERLVLQGGVRLGQEPARGSAMENPLGAEIHVAIAPHGKALGGAELQRQLNGPIGNPTLWWGARFPSP